MIRSTDPSPSRKSDARPWLRLLFAMTLPVVWLVAGILLLPAAS